jgi:hypothetical protein
MASDRWIIAARPRLAAHSYCTFRPSTQKARCPSRPDFDKKRREPFLSLLRGFDGALVPSLSDEQPRILYDAFSQAVPVIGSAT